MIMLRSVSILMIFKNPILGLFLLSDRSIRDNITYGLENYTEEDVLEAIRMANIETAIMELPDVIFS